MQGPAFEHLKNHKIVRAGAGAGKTYALTHKVMEVAETICAKTDRFPRIIVTTFTRKATQELRERLMLLVLEEKPELVEFVNSRSHLVVSTIHGVMDLFLKRYGGSVGIDPGYRIVGPAEAGKTARKVLRGILLNDAEAGALLESFQFNKLVSIFRRIDQLILENPDCRPFQLEDFTTLFEGKAGALARQLKSVASKIKDESTKADWLMMAADFDALAEILLLGNWPINRAVFLQRLDAIKTARKNAKAPPVTDETADEAKAVREDCKALQEPLYDPSAWADFSTCYQLIERLARAFSAQFRKEKSQQGLLEISDLETTAMDCIRRFPESVDAFWKEWDYWLVDEYQDTSPFQVELLRKLSGERPSFIVGDPQQSIYLFRGARSEVFGAKESEVLGAGGERILLTTNRRSRRELLLFLNDFFGAFTPPFQPMQPLESSPESPRHVVVANIFIAAAVEESTDDVQNEEPDLLDVGKNDSEMRALVAHVQSLLRQGAKYDEICVLARTNRTLAEVSTWLGRYRIPTHVHASSGFFDRREIRDALALLKFLVHPHDGFNLIELLRSPWFRMPDATIAEVTGSRPESIWEEMIKIESMADEFAVLRRLQRWLETAQTQGLSDTFRCALVESAFIDLAHVHDVSGRRESNLWKLIAKLQQEECKPGFNPIEFINTSINDLKMDEANAEGDAVAAVEAERVNLMTVHSSKGLEFKHVVVPQMGERPRLTNSEDFTYDEDLARWALRIPYGEDRSLTKSLPEQLWLEKFRVQELAEHARVLYVALTRAIDSVYLSWSLPFAKNSWAEMVQLNLEPGEHREKDYVYNVISTEPKLEAVAETVSERISLRPLWREKISAAEADWSSASNAIAGSLSVTNLLETKSGVQFGIGETPEIAARLKVTSEGSAVHRLMELLKYPSQSKLQEIVRKWFPGQEEKILSGIDFVRACQEPPLLEIIQNGEVEWGFSIVEKGMLIEGQADLWGRTDSGEAWLIDYKTGHPRFRDKAFEQMSLYALALRKAGLVAEGERLNLAAVYPFSKQIFFSEAQEIQWSGFQVDR